MVLCHSRCCPNSWSRFNLNSPSIFPAIFLAIYCPITQGGAVFILSSAATFIDLTVQSNTADYGADIYNEQGSFTCGSSCGIGQYGDCSKTALTSESNYECYVNCASSCRSCPAGTSNAITGSASNSSCHACPVGHASTGAGAASCTSCEAGYFATDKSGDYIILTKATNCSAVSSGVNTIHLFA